MPSVREIKAGAAYVELFTKDSRFVRGLRLAERRLRAFGQKASQIGKRMLLLSGAIAAPLVFASRTFAGFEDQMKAVQAVTGAVGDEFERLYKQAKNLGRTTSFTAAQVAEGMLNLGRAGFRPAEIEAAIAKEGWHYLWTFYEDAEDSGAQALVKNPKAVYVEQVYEYGNFAALGLPDPWS